MIEKVLKFHEVTVRLLVPEGTDLPLFEAQVKQRLTPTSQGGIEDLTVTVDEPPAQKAVNMNSIPMADPVPAPPVVSGGESLRERLRTVWATDTRAISPQFELLAAEAQAAVDAREARRQNDNGWRAYGATVELLRKADAERDEALAHAAKVETARNHSIAEVGKLYKDLTTVQATNSLNVASLKSAQAERDQYRVALKALVEALPKCDVDECNSTAIHHSVMGASRGTWYCDKHAGDDHFMVLTIWPYAPALRRCLELLKGEEGERT
jgi:hypothetical protein